MTDKLEFLVAVAWEKNVSRAAEVCRVRQPTLSADIKLGLVVPPREPVTPPVGALVGEAQRLASVPDG